MIIWIFWLPISCWCGTWGCALVFPFHSYGKDLGVDVYYFFFINMKLEGQRHQVVYLPKATWLLISSDSFKLRSIWYQSPFIPPCLLSHYLYVIPLGCLYYHNNAMLIYDNDEYQHNCASVQIGESLLFLKTCYCQLPPKYL